MMTDDEWNEALAEYELEALDRAAEEAAREEAEYWRSLTDWQVIRKVRPTHLWIPAWIHIKAERYCARAVGRVHVHHERLSRFENLFFRLASAVEFRLRTMVMQRKRPGGLHKRRRA